MNDADLLERFERLPEKGKHFIALIRDELLDLRHRVQALEDQLAHGTTDEAQ